MSQSRPLVIHDPREMREWVRSVQSQGQRVGVVPTMGALHAGHLSLARAAREQCDRCVTTIFVNPTQFAPTDDLAKYPRTLEADLDQLASVQCDVAFVPTVEAMYGPSFSTYVDPPKVAEPLEGSFRPGHFRGVCTVVLKLLNIVPADVAVFGAKDYQQAMVVRHMVRDLAVGTRIDVRPTIREPDGLAMSSRNTYLSADERTRALALSQALLACVSAAEQGECNRERLEAAMHRVLAPACDSIDYAVVVDADSLECRDVVESESVALIAARIGSTRLIDNRVFRVATR
ncbi:MAG: pantoate--beta-alanine ligase [Planctomycetales bacterium]|nr:pantoate--beta-alanine ligase [Planctomycetales bacterium]